MRTARGIAGATRRRFLSMVGAAPFAAKSTIDAEIGKAGIDQAFETSRVEIALPTLHPDQVAAYNVEGRFLALRCGRRWGKTLFDQTIAVNCALGIGMPGGRGGLVGWFAPENRKLSEAYNEMKLALAPATESSNKTDGFIKLLTGGRIDFWSLDDVHAGRSRKYDGVIIDEAAFARPVLMETWERAIKPTLFDRGGWAVVSSNTNGIDPDNFFWRICNEPKHGFMEYHAPTRNNPHLPERDPADSDEAHQAKRDAELRKLIAENPPLVYSQEYEAEFVDWSGVSFFTADSLLRDGKPLEMPTHCDGVFAVIDSATKTGKDHDGTAVLYVSYDGLGSNRRVTLLDWDIRQIEGALLIHWLPEVKARLEELSRLCRARAGARPVFIEDKASGMILLQQAARAGLAAVPINSKLTSVGKDERAISVSGHVYRGKVKFAAPAWDKVSVFKGSSRNHLRMQITGFRIGSKDAGRQDDLLDAFCYSVALALGNSEGL
jgi:hypothetical protein